MNIVLKVILFILGISLFFAPILIDIFFGLSEIGNALAIICYILGIIIIFFSVELIGDEVIKK